MSAVFVGRVQVLEGLGTLLAEARAGSGAFALVSGEPGIGKSRLAEEVARRAEAAGWKVAWGRSWEGAGTPAFWPWTQVLRRLVADGAVGAAFADPALAPLLDHANRPTAPEPAPTVAYGTYIGRMCQGCHGATLSGGPIPGAPPDLAVPRNLTRHSTGLAGWTLADFEEVMRTGIRKNGDRLDPFMPREALVAMNDVERRALWAFLQSVPPAPFGGR